MEEEVKNFLKVWGSAIISVSYYYYLSTRIKPGVFRLLAVLPVCVLFIFLYLSRHWFHCLVPRIWLATFKLILFSFDKGPLYPIPPSQYPNSLKLDFLFPTKIVTIAIGLQPKRLNNDWFAQVRFSKGVTWKEDRI